MTGTNEVHEYDTDEFQCKFPWKDNKGLFFLRLSKSGGRGGGKGIETVPASSWFDGHLIFQSPIPRGRTWRNSVKPVLDETRVHPSRRPLGEEKQKQSSLPYCEATSCLQNPQIPSLLALLSPLLNLYSSRLRKTPLEIVNKPATHTKIKQKETWTIPPSLLGFITRCKVKTKEERNDTSEFILPKSFISGFFIPQP